MLHPISHHRPVVSVWRYPKSKRNRIRNFFPIPNFSLPEYMWLNSVESTPHQSSSGTNRPTKIPKCHWQYVKSFPNVLLSAAWTLPIPKLTDSFLQRWGPFFLISHTFSKKNIFWLKKVTFTYQHSRIHQELFRRDILPNFCIPHPLQNPQHGTPVSSPLCTSRLRNSTILYL